MHVRSKPKDGRGFEEEFFGYSFQKARALFRHCQSCSEKSAIRRVKECQHCLGWNPRQPKTALARGLFDRVSARLGSRGRDLRLFAAVGSSLDIRGIDGWFERDHVMVTIDLTVSAGKEDPRAHLVITRSDFLTNRHYSIGDWIAEMLLR